MRAVIFDLDGTLVDTVGDIAAAADHVLAAHGLPTHEESFYRRAVGDGAPVLIERVVPQDRQDLVPTILAGFREYYRQHMYDSSRPYEGVEALLRELTDRSTPMAVLSNKPEPLTQAMAKALLPAAPFIAVWGHVLDRPTKPDPTAALAIAAEMAVPPAECLFVGDTPVDMKTARRAGMTAVGVPWGFRPVEELRASGAEFIIEQASDILGLL
ncbi:MAG: HAD family hydrolase [Deltaproteobacteria bacterium]|jgi:phosphoglycolate phosphatase|nr:HAD family hydrolase [Deltaproteobacteria bacterium]MBW2534185.1 HAD family hydrolase [Deltaproteobacteria bacterium]